MKRQTFLILFMTGLSLCRGIDDLLVETSVGTIQGVRSPDDQYTMFMGIPYAILNKNNPFDISEPHPHFKEILRADNDSAICPQVDFNNTVGTFDCLHLNVYVPDSASEQNLLPVLVWIHGGDYKTGSAGRYLYGPKYFIRQDIILVTFNYRVGPYGFMCLDVSSVPGNQGLRDQQLALKWVKYNIEGFSGDSQMITIAGNSYGAISVDIHLLNSKEKLFNQVIMQSGTALYPGWLREPDKAAPIKLASSFDFITDDSNDAIQFLAGVSSDQVIAVGQMLDLEFLACIETVFDDVEPLIIAHPLSQKPGFSNIKMLIGGNSDEGLLQYLTMTPKQIADLNIFENLLNNSFNFNEDKMKRMVELVKLYYIGDDPISVDVKDALVKVYSDFMFYYPISRTIKKYLGSMDAVYAYIFAYDGQLNFQKNRLNVRTPGTAHADEITYLFESSFTTARISTKDHLIIERLTTLWANFVKFGNPTPTESELLPIIWPAVTRDAQYFLNIDNDLVVGKRFFGDRMAFWELFYEINEQFEKGYNSEGPEMICKM